MSEHHHSLKRETFHETNPLLYEALWLSARAMLKGRARKWGRESDKGGEKGYV